MRNCSSLFWILAIWTISIIPSSAQTKKNLVYVDKQGVLRYTSGKQEAAFYGVNYTTPFAHAYRAQKKSGHDLEEVIKQDVYHFARMGLQAFRVHVWDTEISDVEGNLIVNEHLRLFDFLLAELKKRNIKTIITPIAFWGNGYPERDEETPGFSRFYGRGKLTTNDSAIKAQENFLTQFFKHKNPYTQLTYEQDKDIIAVEINNEPSHSFPKSGVTAYINRLAAAIRNTGWTKPVYYNIAQGPAFADAVAAAKIDGVSFQWYPSGLVGNQTIKGNTLMHVDKYANPFVDTIPAARNKSMMVYEFDAADIISPYMYPFMAKAFRGAGFQWATQFAYDPIGMAHVNTEYQTHYLNLAYTPAKAISMMIAAEVFQNVPRGKSYGVYPADSSFDVFRVSYKEQLSEMNSPEKFYYSGNTSAKPVAPSSLRHIAGTGNSPIVQYSGSGAYFLDKLEDGVWRLEVFPDAIPVRDPFERASPNKTVTAIEWSEQIITISLPDLQSNFDAKPLGKTEMRSARFGNRLQVTPGIYLLTRNGKLFDLAPSAKINNIGVHEFVAPPATKQETLVRHQPPAFVNAGQAVEIHAIANELKDAKAFVYFRRGRRPVEMQQSGYKLWATLPAGDITDAFLEYRIVLQRGDNYESFPGKIPSLGFEWDTYETKFYSVPVRSNSATIELFNPSHDTNIPSTPDWRRGFQTGFVSGSITGTALYQMKIEDLKDQEILGAQVYIGEKTKQLDDSETPKFIVVRARIKDASKVEANLVLVNSFGTGFASSVAITDQWQDIQIPVSLLKQDKILLLPRPYPSFQPLFFVSSEENARLRWKDIEKVQIYTKPKTNSEGDRDFTLQIEHIRLLF